MAKEEEKKQTIMTSGTDGSFKCSMDGYKNLTLQSIDLALFALALIKETYAAILPEDLGKAVNYAW